GLVWQNASRRRGARHRVFQHGVRPGRTAAAIRRRSGHPGRRLPQDGERSWHSTGRCRAALSGRILPADAHVTNAVHVPSWDSAQADALWTQACGKERWLGGTESLTAAIESLSDETFWDLRSAERGVLVERARMRLAMQLGQR